MIYNKLGDTGLKVSAVSLGTLTLGPLQLDFSYSKGGELIRNACDLGINLFDTAEIYKTYGHLKYAKLPSDGSSFIVSKSYACDFDSMKLSVKKAIEETQRPFIDIFMLHQQESELTLKGHKGALDYLIQAKKDGLIKFIGISTHHINAVKASFLYDEIEVIFAVLNYKGLGIMDGTREEMELALNEAYKRGKGILIMKAFGGGHFFRETKKALEYVSCLPFVSSVVIGAQCIEEIKMNSLFATGKTAPLELEKTVAGKKRQLNIEFESCIGCGNCAARCPQKAITIVNGKAVVNHSACVLCAYCASVCGDFCIEVI